MTWIALGIINAVIGIAIMLGSPLPSQRSVAVTAYVALAWALVSSGIADMGRRE